MTEGTTETYEAQSQGRPGGVRPSPGWSWIAPALMVGGLIAAWAVTMGTCI